MCKENCVNVTYVRAPSARHTRPAVDGGCLTLAIVAPSKTRWGRATCESRGTAVRQGTPPLPHPQRAAKCCGSDYVRSQQALAYHDTIGFEPSRSCVPCASA